MIVGNADNDCVAFSGLEHFLGGGVVFYTFTKLFLKNPNLSWPISHTELISFLILTSIKFLCDPFPCCRSQRYQILLYSFVVAISSVSLHGEEFFNALVAKSNASQFEL